MLAMGLAFALKLDTPYSAATTAMIVSQPVHGMIFSKSLYRLGGTVIGAVVAVTLMGLFAQAPEMFIFGLGLWMGVCTALSTLLRSFRSYGAVLAGYTVVLITIPGVDQPNMILTLAMARVAEVALGIVCSAVVASLLTRRTAEHTLENCLRHILGELCNYCHRALSGEEKTRLTEQRRSLALEISRLASLAEFAAAESPEIGFLADGLRGTVAAMFGTLTAAASLHGALDRQSAQPSLDRIFSETTAIIERLSTALPKGDLVVLDEIVQALDKMELRLEDAIQPTDLPLLVGIDRLDEVIDELALCLEGLTGLLGRRAGVREVTLQSHLDWRWAATNGARATITVWAAGALWFLSAWTAGGAMLASVVPNVALLSLRDSPTTDSLGFIWGPALAAIVGFLCLIWIFPQITGFPLLVLTMAPFLLIGVLATAVPRFSFGALGFCVFFITLLAPNNLMTYDPEAFLNNAFATVAGGILTTLVYRLLLPVNLKARKRTLVLALQRDLQSLLRTSRPIPRAAWEARMHDRLLLLGARLRAAGINADTSLRGGFAALRIGREVLRLRDLLLEQPQPLAIVRPALASLESVAAAPSVAVRSCHSAAKQLLDLATAMPREQATGLGRSAASLLEIAMLVGQHRRFFQPVLRM
jgi:uncharacterized membrane protein YccC